MTSSSFIKKLGTFNKKTVLKFTIFKLKKRKI